MSSSITSIPCPVRRCRRRAPETRNAILSFRQTVSHSEVFDSAASVVWDILVDWGSIVDWMPRDLISSLELEGTGTGAIRHIVTHQGVHIAERLERADEGAGQLELSILEPLPWDMLSYRALAQLDELGPGQCRLRWEGSFELPEDGQAAKALTQLLGKSYKLMFAGLRQYLAES